MKIAFIGIGRLGGALALALREQNHEIGELVSGDVGKASLFAESFDPKPRVLNRGEFEKISSEAVFITVPDSQIRSTAENLAGKLKHRPIVFHASGALSSETLESLREAGCAVGSLHPLVSVSDARRGAASFENAYFCIEGDARATAAAQKIAADLGAHAFSIQARFKPLYHASAVASAGHVTALFSVALEMLGACGLSEDEARKILLPLVESTIKNLVSQSPAQALTGTFARADAETLKRHLELLKTNVSAQATEIYRLLGLRSLDLAAAQGADPERLAEMRTMLSERHF